MRLFEDIIDNQNIVDDDKTSSAVVSPDEPIWTHDRNGAQIYEYDLTFVLNFEFVSEFKKIEDIAQIFYELIDSSRCIDDTSRVYIDRDDMLSICVNFTESARVQDFINLLCRINNKFYSQSSASSNFIKLIRPKKDLTSEIAILNLHYCAMGGLNLSDLVFYAKMSDYVHMENGSNCAYMASKLATSFYGYEKEKQMGSIRYTLDALENINENKLRGYEEVKARYA